VQILMPAGRTCDSGIPIVIAYEIGQAIGLRHNSDARALMCGRPASCRPDAFASQTEHYFLLTAEEKSLLLVLYPADWRARQPLPFAHRWSVVAVGSVGSWRPHL